jgi:transposase
MFEAGLDEVPAVRTPTGRRRCRPGKVHADKAYDHRRCRTYLHRRRIKARIARRGIESSERLGRHRWKIERSIAWLLGCRRLRVRYDRSDERFYAFALLASALVCHRTLTTPPW